VLAWLLAGVLAGFVTGLLAGVLAGVQNYCIRTSNVPGADRAAECWQGCQAGADMGAGGMQPGASRELTWVLAGCQPGASRVLTGKLARWWQGCWQAKPKVQAAAHTFEKASYVA
jgi:hypothetical protein